MTDDDPGCVAEVLVLSAIMLVLFIGFGVLLAVWLL